MASIRKKAATQYWFACFTDSSGIQRQRSTKTTNRKAALAMAERLEEAYRRRIGEAQMRRMLSDAHMEMHGTPIDAVKLGTFLDQWLVRIKPDVQPGTHARYSEPVGALKKLRPELAAKDITHVTAGDLIDLRNAMLEARGASTVNTNMKILRIAFRVAWQDGVLSENVAARVPMAKREASTGAGRRKFTLDELRRLLAVADDEWRGIILTGLYAGGARLGDVVRLAAGNVDLTRKTIDFRTGKTQRWMAIPIPDVLADDLRGRITKDMKRDTPVFPTVFAMLRGAKGGDVSKISARFARLLYKAGLRDNPSTAKARVDGRRTASELTFHSLRHTATSMMKNAGVSDSVVRDIVGHESEAVSAEYTHIDEATKRAALAKMPDVRLA